MCQWAVAKFPPTFPIRWRGSKEGRKRWKRGRNDSRLYFCQITSMPDIHAFKSTVFSCYRAASAQSWGLFLRWAGSPRLSWLAVRRLAARALPALPADALVTNHRLLAITPEHATSVPRLILSVGGVTSNLSTKATCKLAHSGRVAKILARAIRDLPAPT